jgi:hypothetical protein
LLFFLSYGLSRNPLHQCKKYFGTQPQCDSTGNCGWTYLAAFNYCKQFGTSFGLVKINNQYQNNHFNRLDGEGAWNLAWIGASSVAAVR